MGVDNIITFDAHDARVQNAIPLKGFENVQPVYQMIKALVNHTPDLKLDNDHMMVISPDEGGMSRCIYYSTVLGLELGADDYVTKPFDAKEVMARVKAVLRRASGSNDAEENSKKIVKYDNLEINIVNYELKVKGVPVDTPPKELELIYHFASNPNRVYTRDQLLDEVWGFDYYGDSRTVDVHVKRLREKLEGVSDKWSLKTVWGVGYKFETKE